MLHLENFILFLRSVLGIDHLCRAYQKDVLIPIKTRHDDMDIRDNITARCVDARRRMHDGDY